MRARVSRAIKCDARNNGMQWNYTVTLDGSLHFPRNARSASAFSHSSLSWLQCNFASFCQDRYERFIFLIKHVGTSIDSDIADNAVVPDVVPLLYRCKCFIYDFIRVSFVSFLKTSLNTPSKYCADSENYD